jgi:hypothetical protein
MKEVPQKAPLVAQGARHDDPVTKGLMPPQFKLEAGAQTAPQPNARMGEGTLIAGQVETAWFGARHLNEAAEIGGVEPGSINISTRAARFATNFTLSDEEDAAKQNQGSQINAYRHALWQASITRRFGVEIAQEVGDAHEENPRAAMARDRRVFSTRLEADEYCDLRNNEIGRAIGQANSAAEMNQLAIQVLEYYRSNGLWIANKTSNRPLFTVFQQQISEEQYTQGMEMLREINKYGFNPQQWAEYYGRRKDMIDARERGVFGSNW